MGVNRTCQRPYVDLVYMVARRVFSDRALPGAKACCRGLLLPPARLSDFHIR
jgi:hypothetical protein